MLIDVHTHLFNANYVPIRGVLINYGLGGIFGGIITNFENRVVDDPDLLNDTGDITSDDEPDTTPPFSFGFEPGVDVPQTLDAYRRALGMYNYVYKYSALINPLLWKTIKEAKRKLFKPISILTKVPDLPLFPDSRPEFQENFRTFVLGVMQAIVDCAGLITGSLGGFLNLMRKSERYIVGQYFDTFRDTALVVNLMMDLYPHVKGDPKYADIKGIQIARMNNLSLRSKAKILNFIAFNPYRDDCMAIVEHALKHRFIGVKFYPPLGYRPMNNEYEGIGSIDGKTLAGIDKNNLELFKFCTDRDIPIMTHCQLGSMDARTEYIDFAQPHYWGQVLDTFPKLRLCFGHAGGGRIWHNLPPDMHIPNADHWPMDGGWYAPQNKNPLWDRSWAKKVVELCCTYENVYCDFSALSGVDPTTDPRRFEAAIHRLQQAVQNNGNNYRFSDKIMFGTDWHMTAQSENVGRFVLNFRQLFKKASLDNLWPAFSSGNALRFLPLEKYIKRYGIPGAKPLTKGEEDYLNGFIN